MTQNKKVFYHFTGVTLRNGDPIPPIGKWLRHKGPVVPCESGLHASPTAFNALQYAPGNFCHRVYLRRNLTPHGDPIDKYAASERMRIASIDATDVLRRFARKVALDVIHLWEAPPIVREYLETGDESKREAARAAAWAKYTQWFNEMVEAEFAAEKAKK